MKIMLRPKCFTTRSDSFTSVIIKRKYLYVISLCELYQSHLYTHTIRRIYQFLMRHVPDMVVLFRDERRRVEGMSEQPPFVAISRPDGDALSTPIVMQIAEVRGALGRKGGRVGAPFVPFLPFLPPLFHPYQTSTFSRVKARLDTKMVQQ